MSKYRQCSQPSHQRLFLTVSSDFKKLNLDRQRLKQSIQNYWEENNCTQGEYVESKPNKHRISYTQNECEVMVDLHFINGGTTTINPKVGKHPDLGEQFAIYLRDALVSDTRKSVNLVVPNIDNEIFMDLLSFLEEVDSEESELPEILLTEQAGDAVKRIIEATSSYKDRITLTHYSERRKLHLQGKPLYGYAQVCYFLSEYTDINGFLDIIYKGGESAPEGLAAEADTIDTELRKLLPNAYDKLGTQTLKLIKTSYILKDVSMKLPDYGTYAYPVLRALEGVMWELLRSKEIYESDFDSGDRSIGSVFRRDYPPSAPMQVRFIVKEKYRAFISDVKICEALELCYPFFRLNRHELFHMESDTDLAKMIPNKAEAVRLIEKTIATIDAAYSKAL